MLSNMRLSEARETAHAATATAATATASLVAPGVGKRNYVTRARISGTGATAATAVAATISGCLGGTITERLGVPADVNATVYREVTFEPPLPATADNLAITLSVPSFGAGNLGVAVALQGFVL